MTTISIALPKGHDPALVGDFLMQMAYCDPAVGSFAVDPDDSDSLRVQILDDAAGPAVKEKAALLASRMLGAGRRPAVLVRECLDIGGTNATNVETELEKRGLVRRVGAGLYHLSGFALQLYEFFDARFSSMAMAVGAVAELYPPFIEVSSLHRIGFFDSTPQYATFVNHLREDVHLIDRFMSDVGRSGSVADSHASLADPAHMLASTVCCHTFSARADSAITGPLVVTARNACTRYEARNLSNLDRLWSFNMREIVFMSESPEFAEDGRDGILGETERFLDTMQLAYRIERANDLFFTPDFSKRVTFQRGLGMKLEVRLLVPPTGGTVACGSFNLHHTNFGRRMGIAGRDGSPIHSSCVGFGLERWVYCFLQQHGLDPDKWPDAARDAVGG